ncbi:anti-sigma factor domain-containing protein [Actinomycetospora callitridis]|uniref:anti-sigma factor n=1 Tax=Actinomycetospora callitridis TaxID=913944 RepID=UPI002366BDB4|nr:anti-sigma factor [Actinomycetospora callitridis]MDD7920684.1 anti-sigma factor [Actinomycetospora callitridis]
MSDRAVPDSHTGAHDALAVGWALHTLDHDEEADFAAHLETCPTCRQTVDETLETLGELAEAVVPVTPPRHLRRRLLDAVAAESAASGEGIDLPELTGAPAAEPAAADAAPAPAAEERDATVVPLSPRRRASRWLAVAAVALVVAAVGGLAVANQSLRTERDAAAAAAAQAERDASVVDVLRDAGTPGVTHATLARPDGTLVGLVVDDGSGARVLTSGLDANGADEVYVLWGLADGTPRPLGTFDVTQQTPAVSSVPSTTAAVPLAGFAVSIEPGRTAPATPTRVVASGQVGT